MAPKLPPSMRSYPHDPDPSVEPDYLAEIKAKDPRGVVLPDDDVARLARTMHTTPERVRQLWRLKQLNYDRYTAEQVGFSPTDETAIIEAGQHG